MSPSERGAVCFSAGLRVGPGVPARVDGPEGGADDRGGKESGPRFRPGVGARLWGAERRWFSSSVRIRRCWTASLSSSNSGAGVRGRKVVGWPSCGSSAPASKASRCCAGSSRVASASPMRSRKARVASCADMIACMIAWRMSTDPSGLTSMSLSIDPGWARLCARALSWASESCSLKSRASQCSDTSRMAVWMCPEWRGSGNPPPRWPAASIHLRSDWK